MEILFLHFFLSFNTTSFVNVRWITLPDTILYTYTFSGWNPEIAPVENNAEYTAQYTETKIERTIDIPSNVENGTVTGTTDDQNKVTITATPDTGTVQILNMDLTTTLTSLADAREVF